MDPRPLALSLASLAANVGRVGLVRGSDCDLGSAGSRLLALSVMQNPPPVRPNSVPGKQTLLSSPRYYLLGLFLSAVAAMWVGVCPCPESS